MAIILINQEGYAKKPAPMIKFRADWIYGFTQRIPPKLGKVDPENLSSRSFKKFQPRQTGELYSNWPENALPA